MTTKYCKVCGKEITDPKRTAYCDKKCAKKHDVAASAAYYKKNWLKWRWYNNSKKYAQNGTCNLSSDMQKTKKGKPNFRAEKTKLEKELKFLGLR